ncbi:MAG: hypothetical protein HC895_15795 [Leptolyngbyaceae cyanobacterium SM1_3_5]|nr:hypothetical protein [Leptolyngbyaceae cyanobacterium SM1_3_5]
MSVACFSFYLAIQTPLGLHHADTIELCPLVGIDEEFHLPHCPSAANLDSAMSFVYRLVKVMLNPRKARGLRLSKNLLDILEQVIPI